MTLQLRKRPPTIQPEIFTGGPPGDPSHDEAGCRNVLVNYGIHRGRFPIGGMRVREARQVLQRLLNIDPSAVAVINGTPVMDPEQIIGDDVRMIHFVKPSSVKGARGLR